MSYDWYEEPSEAEILEMAVCDDAADPDSHALQHRQNQRWEEFLERNKLTARNTHARLDAVARGGLTNVPTWWELWLPLGDRPLDLVNHGRLIFTSEYQHHDVHSWHAPVRTMLTGASTWMDFYPVTHHGMPDLSLFRKMPSNVVVDQATLFAGREWGWWDYKKGRMRTRIMAVKQVQDKNIAVKMVTPPPYGHWMPCFDLNLKTMRGEI